MFGLTSLTEPIVQAPMAGGPSTPELALAVCGAGGLGFLAAGYKPAEVVREEISTVRASTASPFGVNLFVPSPAPADPASLREYLEELEPEAERFGVELGEPRYEDDDWERKLELVLDERVAVVSFTFGCPARRTWLTVCTARGSPYGSRSPARSRPLRHRPPARMPWSCRALKLEGTEAGLTIISPLADWD